MGETVQYLRQYLQNDPTQQSVEAGELVKRILIDAITADASDIHIEPWESSLCVRIRCNGVLGTRLVRRNCPDCRVEYSPDDAYLRMLPREDLTHAKFMMGGGCGNCFSTGFSGRTAVTEMLVVDQVFRDAVMQKMSTRNLQQVAVNQGMRTLWDNGVRRAVTGESPLEEILRVISFDDM